MYLASFSQNEMRQTPRLVKYKIQPCKIQASKPTSVSGVKFNILPGAC